MGYTIHDMFDEKITCESINKYIEDHKGALSYDSAIFDLLDLKVFRYGDASYLDSILMFVFEEICYKKSITGDSGKFHYLFKKLAPEKRLDTIIYGENRIEVRTTFNSFAQRKPWTFRSLFNFLDKKEKEAKDFDIRYFFKRLQDNELLGSQDDFEYLSSYDIFRYHIKNLDGLEFLEKFFMLGIQSKFEDDEAVELPTKLDSIFDMITYEEECSLKKVVYSEVGQVSTLEYPNYDDE
jgi:hypothetical protein